MLSIGIKHQQFVLPYEFNVWKAYRCTHLNVNPFSLWDEQGQLESVEGVPGNKQEGREGCLSSLGETQPCYKPSVPNREV